MDSALSRVLAQVRAIAERTGRPPRYLSASLELFDELKSEITFRSEAERELASWVEVKFEGETVEVFPVGKRTEWPKG